MKVFSKRREESFFLVWAHTNKLKKPKKKKKRWLFGLAKSIAYPKGRSNIDTIYFLFQLNFITMLSLMFSNKLQKLTLHMGEGGKGRKEN